MRSMNVLGSTLHGYREALTGRIPLGALTLLVAVAALVHGIAQDPIYHQFADQRPGSACPHAADVLSNLAFALVGVVGLVRLASRDVRTSHPRRKRACGASRSASSAPRWARRGITSPRRDATLFWDRLPMTLVFAGVLGAALAQRVGPATSARPEPRLLLVPLGIASVAWWKRRAISRSTLRFNSAASARCLLLLVVTRRAGDAVSVDWVIAWYALAKAAELADRAIWSVTGGVVAGHALKHLLAAARGRGGAVAALETPLTLVTRRRSLPLRRRPATRQPAACSRAAWRSSSARRRPAPA